MFTVLYRQQIREKILQQAKNDHRIVSAAIIGSYAHGQEDRWSDIDLTFGVDESFTLRDLINSWTDYVEEELEGVMLFELPYGATTYLVYILPGCLQLDLSFSPATQFGALGPNFKLLYGKQYEKPELVQPPEKEVYGYMVHHILRARLAAERGRLWQAEFWMTEARNLALKLACQSRGLNTEYGRGFDDLPENILDLLRNSFIKELNKEEIVRCIQIIVSGIPAISETINEYYVKMSGTINELALSLKDPLAEL